jgi:serine/threonine protein kinase
MSEKEALIKRIKELTGMVVKPHRFKIVEDTTDWMRISRGDVMRLADRDFVVRGNMYEPRFGIDEQPKYWVFSAVDLETGAEKIIKTVFHEEFYAHIGILRIRCYRSPEKEADVLDFVRGDERFMQGYTAEDYNGNIIRIIDFIKGKSFFKYIPGIDMPHEQYYFEVLPEILRKLFDAFTAIKYLHDNGMCHGDIRNDHIILETETGRYRWIDFDLKQDVSDFDMWSFGNILNYSIAKGIKTFGQVMKENEFGNDIKNSLKPADGAAFFNYRIINLKKLYPYVSDSLNDMLMHFAIKPLAYFRSIDEFVNYFETVINNDFK